MPKISLAMIVRNESLNLTRCLASVAAFVDEIIVVDTGSTDNTKEIALSFGATVYDFTPQTNPESFFMDDESTGAPPPYTNRLVLGDFAAARTKAFEKTTGDYVFWLDADDQLLGGEHIRGIVDNMKAGGIEVTWFPYHYGHDPMGRVICLLWRERIIKRGRMRWTNPIHEVLVPVSENVSAVRRPEVVVKHCRSVDRTAAVANRNYKVLLRHVGKEDARTLFYFGNEARHVNPAQAMKAYERYVEISGWAEERCIARCYMGEICETQKKLGMAEAHYAAATVESVNLPDGWFGLARIAFYKNAWSDVIRLTDEGFKRGTPETVIMINPLSRTLGPHIYYNIALNAVGRVQEAHDSCLKALALVPEDGNMRHNFGRYREFLDVQAAMGGPVSGTLSHGVREGALLAITPFSAESPPEPLSDTLLRRAALRLWKECVKSGELLRGRSLLASLPDSIRHHAEITTAVAASVPRGEWKPSSPELIASVGALAPSSTVLVNELEHADDPAALLCRYGDVVVASTEQKDAGDWRDHGGRRRRLTYRSLLDLFEDAGLEASQIRKKTIAGESALIGIAKRGSDRSADALDVVIWTGQAVEPWSPDSPGTTGIGGSETACVEMGRHLVSLGHRVTVYGDCPDREGRYDGVDYLHHESFAGAKCDVFISSRAPSIIDRDIQAKVKLLWVHDIHVGQADPNMHRWLLRFDRILCLSQWHKQFFLASYPFVHPSAVIVTRNGIDPDRFAGEMPPKTNKLIYSSSANRGLDALLDMMPAIKERVPDVELHVFYGFESWEATTRMTGNVGELAVIEGYRRRLSETPGVVYRGRVDQATLAREMMTAKVHAYPTAFTETFCISAVEAQAAGCVPVTSTVAALPETARWGILIPGDNNSPGYREVFVNEVAAILKDEDRRSAVAHAGRAWALKLSWATLAKDWEAMFRDLAVECASETPRYERIVKAA